MVHNFRELNVWKKSIELSNRIYLLTKNFPPNELYALTSQMQRAVVSIPTNIAEGAGRSTDKDFSHFLSIALGSAYELETELVLANNFGYVAECEYNEVNSLIVEVQKMLCNLINRLNKV
jgi:four helix bundle protein